jgi:hypothetical protein
MELNDRECANIRNILNPLANSARDELESAERQIKAEDEAGVRGITSAYLSKLRSRNTLNNIKLARNALGKCGCQL